jgi:uncharacterized protein (TIGR03067 family)
MARKDLDLLQGVWTVTALDVEGQPLTEGMLRDARIKVNGNRFSSTGMGAVYEGIVELNTTRNPRELNMKFDAGPEKGNTNLGIYELDGDTWRMCIATRGSVRPSQFIAPAGSGFAVETLIRGDAPRQAAAEKNTSRKSGAVPSTGPSTELEGEWPMVSAVMDGIPMDESAVKWVKRVCVGNQVTVLAGPQVMLKVEFTIDAQQSPKAIDYVITAGPNKGKTQYGIYEMDGNTLRVCMSAPGEPRATQFHSARGDKRTFTVWKRSGK